ncbi:hypothetical protein D9757_010811 [Collybiopsis confluens]|uniref:G domain-containing protein n=1 Tax=Collybiopsis confluens TaxID=2823264 RepID=A0A8H5GUF8_9AGAR|nr:hypothetical protein D9757_010811 [Collybiopsis confluens]
MMQIFKPSEKPKEKNVILFGSTGSGKSSVVNMLLAPGSAKATVSSKATGCTFQSESYIVEVENTKYKVWDTAGFDEGGEGKVSKSDSGGVSLLVFVMKGRVTNTAQQNYEMFYRGFCEAKVPVVIVVTGMEEENEDGDSRWWEANRRYFDARKMFFEGAACITSTKGLYVKKLECHVYQDVYDTSIAMVRGLISQHCAEEGWRKEPTAWALQFWKWASKFFKVKSKHSPGFMLERTKTKMIMGETIERLDEAPSNSVLDMNFKKASLSRVKTQVFGHRTKSDVEPNIVLFGTTGCGKSSVVNMLLGANKEGAEEPRAKVSSSAKGCISESKPYLVDCEGKSYKVWDTTGLDEGIEGTVASLEAFDKLCTLIKHLSRRNGGVSLLMFVMKAPRVTETTRRNYQMFYEGFCEKQVPVVIVITGLENEQHMDYWWMSNEHVFREKQMHFEGTACISAIMGRYNAEIGGRAHQEAYDASVLKVKGLIIDHCPTDGWKKVKLAIAALFIPKLMT